MCTNRIFTTLVLCALFACIGLGQSSKAIGHDAAETTARIGVQHIRESIGTETVIVKQPEVFPQSWFGEYAGTLKIFSAATGLSQIVPMRMLLDRTDTAGVYKWHIVYGEDTVKGLRPYLLRTVDAKKGHYQFDELNTIRPESYFVGDKLFCHYIVGGNDITTVEEKLGDTLIFEIIFGKNQPVSETGGAPEKINGEKIPAVKSLPVIIYQKAVLKKVK